MIIVNVEWPARDKNHTTGWPAFFKPLKLICNIHIFPLKRISEKVSENLCALFWADGLVGVDSVVDKTDGVDVDGGTEDRHDFKYIVARYKKIGNTLNIGNSMNKKHEQL